MSRCQCQQMNYEIWKGHRNCNNKNKCQARKPHIAATTIFISNGNPLNNSLLQLCKANALVRESRSCCCLDVFGNVAFNACSLRNSCCQYVATYLLISLLPHTNICLQFARRTMKGTETTNKSIKYCHKRSEEIFIFATATPSYSPGTCHRSS